MLFSSKRVVLRLTTAWLVGAGVFAGVLCSSDARAESAAVKATQPTLAPLLAKVLPAVVSIRVIGQRYLPTELKAGMPAPEPKTQPFKAGGSGVIFDAKQGLIGTNNHVVKDAIAIGVGLHDGRSARAKLLGVDIGTDIAILKIDLPDLTALPLGNSDSIKIGDYVVAVGNPFGLEGTATTGIVSGLMRSEVGYEIFESFIQTDAAVNPGNSGGALVNLEGELIGINTAIAGGGSNVGIGFAIPINMARRIGRQILLHGHMPRGTVGLTTEDISPDASRALRRTRGAMISRVEPKSPAELVGLSVGHVVVAIDGETIRSNADYMTRLGSSAIGETLQLEVASESAVKKVSVTVADFKVEPTTTTIPGEFRGMGGMTVASIEPGSPLYGVIRGAVIKGVEPQSVAEKTGFQPGDVIVGIDHSTIRHVSQVAEVVHAGSHVDQVKINRGGIPYVVQLPR